MTEYDINAVAYAEAEAKLILDEYNCLTKDELSDASFRIANLVTDILDGHYDDPRPWQEVSVWPEPLSHLLD